MKPEPNPEIDFYRRSHPVWGDSEKGANYGFFVIQWRGYELRVVASDGDEAFGNWEHVSVSLADRCPTWEQMAFIKSLFWTEDETVIQFHPKKSAYVNNHPYCLHMWKKAGIDQELPPEILTGIKSKGVLI